MAHSPLLRTVMRLKLDRRCVALANYELALEDVSISLQQPPSKENFDDSRWAELRKVHDSKKERERLRKVHEKCYVAMMKKKREFLDSCRPRQLQHLGFFRAWEDSIPQRGKGELQFMRSTVLKSGFADWKAPLPSDSLLFEQGSPVPPTCGRVNVGDMGILDRRLLHLAISPKYVPKPHFKMERKRLAAKSVEFAAFVAQQTSLGPERSLIPRPEDDTSDQGLVSSSESDSSIETAPPIGNKRKRSAAVKTKKPVRTKKSTRKPPSFSKLCDCKAHDRTQLKAQAINWFSLMQQRLPRVEFPAFEHAGRRTAHRPVVIPQIVEGVDEDPNVQILEVHGILLPVQLPRSEDTEAAEDQQPTDEDAARYREWRSQARPFFDERDRYLQRRVYYEKVQDRTLTHTVQSLMGFWNKVLAQGHTS
ncbi:hypothetical protein GGR53DRAFT_525098 [Hypoxylon sp. FL1150]|nr:hypothetical protein GGR53DRAFT_525098 [Hypoxylon sp. FL1150]